MTHTRTGTEQVHALLILLGNDRRIRDTVNATESKMMEVLRQVSSHGKVNLTVMKSSKEAVGSTTTYTLQNGRTSNTRGGKPGDLIRSYQVVDWLNRLKLDEDDTVLIYYNGHGKMDSLGTHTLQFDLISSDTLDRERLGTLLNQKRARLRMLITDTCSETIDAEDVEFRALARTRERKPNYMEDLFLTHAGFLDITAASPGEVAIGNPDEGGHFTYALFTHGCAPGADKNNDDFITWKEAFDTTEAETNRLFKQASPELNEVLGRRSNRQKTQTPIAYSLPKPLEQPTKPTTEAPPPQIDEPPIVSPEAIEVETTATLNFTSVPSDAEVFIDDAFAGNTPLRDFEIETDGRSTKKIKVSVKARGRKDVVKELWVQRGKSVNHEFTLTKDIPKTITGGDGKEIPQTIAKDIHALLILLGNDRVIADVVMENKYRMVEMLKQLSQHCNVRLTTMESIPYQGEISRITFVNENSVERATIEQDAIKAKQVLEWIENLNPKPEDTVLIYYSGHGEMGAFDTHYLLFDPDLSADTLDREKLSQKLEQKPARLRMLITDAHSFMEGETGAVSGFGGVVQIRGPRQKLEMNGMVDLFLRHAGFLDITAASPGQHARASNDIGGFFTNAFVSIVSGRVRDANGDKFISWEEAFTAVISRVEATLMATEKSMGQAIKQNPTAYSLPTPRPDLTN